MEEQIAKKCGGQANLVSGTFSERGQGLEVVSGPPQTHAVVSALRKVAERAAASKISSEQAAAEASDLVPWLGDLLQKRPGLVTSIVAILIALVALYNDYRGNVSDSEFQDRLLKKLDSISSQSASENRSLNEMRAAQGKQTNDRSGVKASRRVANKQKKKHKKGQKK